jgi:hypothetical protein
MHLLRNATQEAWLWLAGSFLVALLWTNLSYLFAPWVEEEGAAETSGSLAERIVRYVGGAPLSPSLFQILRILYYLGIPAAALFWGRDAVVARFLGLQPLLIPDASGGAQGADVAANWAAWLHDLGWAAAVTAASGGLLALASLTQRVALSTVETEEARDGRVPPSVAAREALYHEVHWAFYRNAPIVTFGPYWGSWIGLLLIGVQAAANPRWRQSLGDPGAAWPALRRAAMAVVSTVLFLHTQNLWLAFLVHGLLLWTVSGPYHSRRSASPGRVSPASKTAAPTPE